MENVEVIVMPDPQPVMPRKRRLFRRDPVAELQEQHQIELLQEQHKLRLKLMREHWPGYLRSSKKKAAVEELKQTQQGIKEVVEITGQAQNAVLVQTIGAGGRMKSLAEFGADKMDQAARITITELSSTPNNPMVVESYAEAEYQDVG